MKIYAAYLLLVSATFAFHRFLLNSKARRWIRLAFGISCASLILFLWFNSEPAWPFDDFKAYYRAAIEIRNPAHLYDQVEKGFVNIPIVTLVFLPFTILKVAQAQILMTFLGVIAVTGTCIWLLRASEAGEHGSLLWIGLVAANGPLINSFREGNITHFLLPVLVQAVMWLRNKSDWKAGLLLGVSAIFKPLLLLYCFYFILTKRWRAAAAFLLSLFVFIVLSLLLFGVQLHLDWFENCVRPFLNRPLGAFNVQSVDSLLARTFLGADVWSWKTLEPNRIYGAVRTFILVILIVPSLWIIVRSNVRKNADEEMTFCCVLCLALILNPVSWTHYYLLLLLPFWFIVSGKFDVPDGWLERTFLFVAVLLSSLPVIAGAAFFQSTNSILQWMARFFVSHYLFGAFLLMLLLLRRIYNNTNRISPPAKT